jgi:hypothetical protein
MSRRKAPNSWEFHELLDIRCEATIIKGSEMKSFSPA